jgi:hypothetical protein
MNEIDKNLFSCLNFKNMTDNINKISENLDGTKHQQLQQQQTSASIVNLTDEGK